MTSHPLVSVIIPVYNGENTIANVISTVLEQSWNNIECIVVDDGSTDDTARVVARFGDKIKYAKQANAGVSSARNHGISMAQGGYVAFLDADDYWLGNKIEHQVRALEDYPDVCLIYTDRIMHVIDHEELISKMPRTAYDIEKVQLFTDFNSIFKNPALGTSAVMVRTSLIKAIGGFDTSLVTSEDIDMYLRICWNRTYAKLDEVLMLKGFSAESLGEQTRSYPDYLLVIDKLLKEHPDFYRSNLALVASKKAQTYAEWAKELLYRGRGEEARHVLWKGRTFGAVPGFFRLYPKSYICAYLARRGGRLEST